MSLTLSNVQVSDNGEYWVVVSNAIGVVRAYVGTLLLEPVSERMVGSGFDADVDGWTVMGDGLNLTFQGHGGNPGGHLLVNGLGGGRGCYWVAPARHLDNQAGAYGGWLKFDLKAPAGSLPLGAQPDVVLWGGGLTLVYVLPPAWGTNWADCLVPLHEGQGWMKDTVGGPAPTREELLTVLGALEAVHIRGELGFGGEGKCLDNVSLEAAVPVALQVERVSKTSIVLAWPVWERDCVLETCLELSGNWTTVGESPAMSNGLNHLTVMPTNTSAFFRLRKLAP
jgi:hypothetical protein